MNWSDFEDLPDPDKTPLEFGKYKGQTPEKICLVDPGYLVWAYESIGEHVCSREMYLACELLAQGEDE